LPRRRTRPASIQRRGGLRDGERFDLIGGLSIGRSSEADLRIDDRYASGLHARIFSRDGRTYVEDMSSTNGTLLNDATLQGEAELIDGDVVRIGDTEFRFEGS
jgi:pSer/pThr/pTyr-binding forkhead associated (FHA) protein